MAFRRRRGGGRKGETGGSSRDPHEPGTAAPAPAPPLVSPRPAIRPPGRPPGTSVVCRPDARAGETPCAPPSSRAPPGARSTFQACASHVRAPGSSGGSASPSRPLRGRPRPPRLRERGQRPSVLETLPSRWGRTTPPRRSGTPGRVLRGDCAGAASRRLGGRRAPRTAAGNQAGRRRGPAGGQPHDARRRGRLQGAPHPTATEP